MRELLIAFIVVGVLVGCSTQPHRLVLSSGFSFANYDYILIAKPEGAETHTNLYGMDVEFANLMSGHNMRVIGDKEYASLVEANKKRTLFARMAANASDDLITLSVSFDDAVSGRTGANITGTGEGDIFELDDRNEVFKSMSLTIIKALQSDKGLLIAEEGKGGK